MKRTFAFVLGTALATGATLSFAGTALAQGYHAYDQSGMMNGMMGRGHMRGDMMPMHRNMMNDGMMGSHMMGSHMMGSEFRGPMDADDMGRGHMRGYMMPMYGNMMGGVMMGPHMMGPHMMGSEFRSLMDANDDGKVEPAEASARLQELLEESDTDSDGTLSIEEFEVLHSRMIRETMVDRFQHLDSDGDGQITSDEMTAPAKRMERMQKRMQMMRQSFEDSGQGKAPGDMMQGGQGHHKN